MLMGRISAEQPYRST